LPCGTVVRGAGGAHRPPRLHPRRDVTPPVSSAPIIPG
jgi:hypothetical protein